MSKLLIVAYAYPPLATVGAVRPKTLALEAQNQGWDVRVLTVSNDISFVSDFNEKNDVKIVRAIHIPVSYFTRWLKWLLPGKEILWSFMDFQYGWVPTAVIEGKKLYKSWPYDAIFTTAPPFSSLRVGASLAQNFNIPSVADLRDPFINNFTRDFLNPRIKKFWQLYYYKLLSKFDERIIVDECIRPELLDLSAHLVRNGYDETEFETPFPERFRTPTIGFIGTIYKEFNLTPIFEAYQLLPLDYQQNSRLLFVGKGSEIAKRRAQRFGLKQVETRPVVPRRDALQIMKQCHGLIYFGSEAVGTKIYEYPRTGALSIQIYEDETQNSYKFADEHNLSVNVRADNPRAIADAFMESFNRETRDYPKSIEKFTRLAAARKILSIIESLLE